MEINNLSQDKLKSGILFIAWKRLMCPTTLCTQTQSFSQISYHGSGEGGESDDSEGENQELAQIDRGM